MSTQPLPPGHPNDFSAMFPMPNQPSSRDPFRFAGSVGRSGENRRDDLIKAQILLGNAGYYDLKGLGAPTGWPGGEIVRSIQRLQKDRGLPADGVMLPLGDDGIGAHGEGETLAALQQQLGGKLAGYAAPTPDQVDAHYGERARRMTHGEADSAGPVSEIVVADEDGTATHPMGVLTPRNAPTPAALPSPRPGMTMSDIDGAPEPQWQDGVQMARGPGLQRPGPRPNPLPEPPRPIPPRQSGPTAAPRQPELRQGPFAPSAGLRPQPLTSEQRQQVRNLLREQEAERLDFRKNPLERHPLREASPPQDQPAETSPPQPRRGRIVIAEDGKEVHVPPLDSWADELPDERRGTAEAVNEALHVILSAEDGSGGSRGSSWTQEGINTLIQSCLKAFDRHPQLAGKMKHVAGGKQDGSGRVQPEEFLGNFGKNGEFVQDGSRKLDLTFEYVGLVIERLRGNTVSTKKPGGPLKDGEQAARDGVVQLANGEYMFTVEKWEKGTPKAVMEKIADAVCDGVAQDFAEHIRRREATLPPDRKPPRGYLGHSKKREAEELRTQRENSTAKPGEPVK